MQPYLITHFVKAAFTKNGDTDGAGIITVATADAALLWPGARVIVGDSDAASEVEALILEDMGGGKFRVRLDDSSAANAGGPVAVRVPGAASSWAAYTTAKSSYVLQPANQMIFPYSHEGVVPRAPSALTGGQ